jgi:DNA-directed RNA polymerase specialized sigma subunit
MVRPYKGHYLNKEQQKLAGDNLNFVWWYIDTQLLKRGRIEPREIDDVAGYLIWHLCMAAEGFDPSKGFKFAAYAKMGMKSGFFRYQQLELPYRAHFILTDFEPQHHSGYDDDQVMEPAYVPHPPKFVGWEDIKWLFDPIEMSVVEKQIVRFYYEFRYTLVEIGEMLNFTRERIRQIFVDVTNRMKEYYKGSDIKVSDFYVEKY